MCGISDSIADNVDPDEVERVEQGAANVLSSMLNVFSGSAKPPKPEAKHPRRGSFKKLTCKGLEFGLKRNMVGYGITRMFNYAA